MKQSASLEVIGGLSAPSKMPCHSWSIPAEYCKLGSHLAKNPKSICSKCYALKGAYKWSPAQRAMENRYAILNDALEDYIQVGERGFFPRTKAWSFINHFASVLNQKAYRTRTRLANGTKVKLDGRYFRWVDSGELQSEQHLDIIVRIAQLTPTVKHWLPTKEVGMVQRWLEMHKESYDARIKSEYVRDYPENLTIRISHPMVDDWEYSTEVVDRLKGYTENIGLAFAHSPGRTPGSGIEACAAPSQKGECLSCRQCWDPKDQISYEVH